MDTAMIKRIRKRVIEDAASGCWLWRGELRHGYGCIEVSGHRRRAHRVMYESATGPIAEGHVVHHECEVPRCVNPAHLRAMTRGDHMRWHRAGNLDGFCRRGHAIEGANAKSRPDRPGVVRCRTCRNAMKRLSARRNRPAREAPTLF